MEALVLSVNEPQLEGCLESLKNQTIPFTNIIHINGVCPQSEAYNRGIDLIKEDWFALLDGDMTLYPDAVKAAMECINNGRGKIYSYSFRLYDYFLKTPIVGVSFCYSPAYKGKVMDNHLFNDRLLGDKIKGEGWKRVIEKSLVGTHFDSPTEFQIFSRFYTSGVKYRYLLRPALEDLFDKTGSPMYSLAIKSLDFSGINGGRRSYRSSHNVELDKAIFEKFKNYYQGKFVVGGL